MFTNQNKQIVRGVFLDAEDADDDDELNNAFMSPIRIKNDKKDETKVFISSTPKVPADKKYSKFSDCFLDNNTSQALSPIVQAPHGPSGKK